MERVWIEFRYKESVMIVVLFVIAATDSTDVFCTDDDSSGSNTSRTESKQHQQQNPLLVPPMHQSTSSTSPISHNLTTNSTASDLTNIQNITPSRNIGEHVAATEQQQPSKEVTPLPFMPKLIALKKSITDGSESSLPFGVSSLVSPGKSKPYLEKCLGRPLKQSENKLVEDAEKCRVEKCAQSISSLIDKFELSDEEISDLVRTLKDLIDAEKIEAFVLFENEDFDELPTKEQLNFVLSFCISEEPENTSVLIQEKMGYWKSGDTSEDILSQLDPDISNIFAGFVEKVSDLLREANEVVDDDAVSRIEATEKQLKRLFESKTSECLDEMKDDAIVPSLLLSKPVSSVDSLTKSKPFLEEALGRPLKQSENKLVEDAEKCRVEKCAQSLSSLVEKFELSDEEISDLVRTLKDLIDAEKTEDFVLFENKDFDELPTKEQLNSVLSICISEKSENTSVLIRENLIKWRAGDSSEDILSELQADFNNAKVCFVEKMSNLLRKASEVEDDVPVSRIETTEKQLKRLFESIKSECLVEMKDDVIVPSLLLSKPVSSFDSLKKSKPLLEEVLDRPLKQSENKLVEDAEKCRVEECAQSVSSLIDKIELSDEEISDLVTTLKDLIDSEKTGDFVLFENEDFDELPTKEQLNSVLSICISEEPENTSVLIREKLSHWKAGDISEDVLSQLDSDTSNANGCFVEKVTDLLREDSEVVDGDPGSRIEATEKHLKLLFESNKSECLDETRYDAIVPSLLLSKPVSSLDSLEKSKRFSEEALGRPLKQSENKLVEDAEKCRVEKCAHSLSSLIDKFELTDEEISDLVTTLKDLIDSEKTGDFVLFENEDVDELSTKEQLNSVLSICISEEPENTSVFIREKLSYWKTGDISEDVLSQLDSDISKANACFVEKVSDLLREANEVGDDDPECRIEATEKQLKRLFESNKSECLDEMKDNAIVPSLLLSKPVSSLDSLTKSKRFLEEALGRSLKQSEIKLVEDAEKCRVEKCAHSLSSLIDKFELSDEEISDLVRTLRDLIDAEKTADFVLFENEDFDELPTKEQLNSVLSICISEEPENTSVFIREKLSYWKTGDISEDVLSQLDSDISNANASFVEKVTDLLREANEVVDDDAGSRIETTEKQLKRLFESIKSECLDEMKDDVIVPSLLLSKPVSSLDSLKKSKPLLEEALDRPLNQSESKLVEDAEKCRVEECAQSVSSLIDKIKLSDEEISDLITTLKVLIDSEKTVDFVLFENEDFDELSTKEQLNSVLSICISEEPENTSVLIREKLSHWKAGDISEDVLSQLDSDTSNANVCFVEKVTDLLREANEVVDDDAGSRIETTEKQLKRLFESNKSECLDEMKDDAIVASLLLSKPVSSLDCLTKSEPFLEEALGRPLKQSENKLVEDAERCRVEKCAQSISSLIDKFELSDEEISDLVTTLKDLIDSEKTEDFVLFENEDFDELSTKEQLNSVLSICISEEPENTSALIREKLSHWKAGDISEDVLSQLDSDTSNANACFVEKVSDLLREANEVGDDDPGSRIEATEKQLKRLFESNKSECLDERKDDAIVPSLLLIKPVSSLDSLTKSKPFLEEALGRPLKQSEIKLVEDAEKCRVEKCAQSISSLIDKFELSDEEISDLVRTLKDLIDAEKTEDFVLFENKDFDELPTKEQLNSVLSICISEEPENTSVLIREKMGYWKCGDTSEDILSPLNPDISNANAGFVEKVTDLLREANEVVDDDAGSRIETTEKQLKRLFESIKSECLDEMKDDVIVPSLLLSKPVSSFDSLKKSKPLLEEALDRPLKQSENKLVEDAERCRVEKCAQSISSLIDNFELSDEEISDLVTTLKDLIDLEKIGDFVLFENEDFDELSTKEQLNSVLSVCISEEPEITSVLIREKLSHWKAGDISEDVLSQLDSDTSNTNGCFVEKVSDLLREANEVGDDDPGSRIEATEKQLKRLFESNKSECLDERKDDAIVPSLLLSKPVSSLDSLTKSKPFLEEALGRSLKQSEIKLVEDAEKCRVEKCAQSISSLIDKFELSDEEISDLVRTLKDLIDAEKTEDFVLFENKDFDELPTKEQLNSVLSICISEEPENTSVLIREKMGYWKCGDTSEDILSPLNPDISNANADFVENVTDLLREANEVVDDDAGSRIETTEKQLKRLFESIKSECLDEMKDDVIVPSLLLSKPVSSFDSLKKSKPLLEEALDRPLKQSENKLVEDAERCRVEKCAQSISILIDKFELSDEEISDLVTTLKDLIDSEKIGDFVLFENEDFDDLSTKEQLNSVLSICISEEPEITSVFIREKLSYWKTGDISEDVLSQLDSDISNANASFVEKVTDLLREANEVVDDDAGSRIETTEKQLKRLFESNKSKCLDEMKDDAIFPSLLLSKPVSSLDSLTKSEPFFEEALGRPLKQSGNKLVEDAERCRVEKCAQSISSLIDKFELSDEEISDLVTTLKDLIDSEKTEDLVLFENEDFDELSTKEQLNAVLSICISEEPENTSVLIREKLSYWKAGVISEDVLSQLDSDISNANPCFVEKVSDLLREANEVGDDDPGSRIEATEKQLKQLFESNKSECLDETKDGAIFPSLLLSKPVSSLESLEKSKSFLEEALGRLLKQSENKLVEDAEKCRVEECAMCVSSLIDKIELSDEEISDLVTTLKNLIDSEKTEDFVWFENKDFDELPTKEQLNSVLSICVSEEPENTSVLIREKMGLLKCGDTSKDVLSQLDSDISNANACFVEKVSDLLRESNEVGDDDPGSRIEATEKQLKRLFESNKSKCLDEMKDDAIFPSLLLSKPVSSLYSLKKSKPYLEEALGRPLKQSENKLVGDAEKCRVEECAQSISSLIDKIELSDEEISDLVRTLKDLIDAEKTEDFVLFENEDFDELPTKEQLNSVLSICISEEPENTSVLIREKLSYWKAGVISEDVLSQLDSDISNANACFVGKLSDVLRDASKVVDGDPDSRIETTQKQLKRYFDPNKTECLNEMKDDANIPSLLLSKPVSSLDSLKKCKPYLEEALGRPLKQSENKLVEDAGKCRVEECAQSVSSLIDKIELSDEEISDLVRTLEDLIDADKTEDFVLFENKDFDELPTKEQLNSVLSICISEKPENTSVLIREKLIKWRAGDSSEDILSELQADFNNAKVCFVEKMSNLLREASEVEDDVPVSRIETTEKQLKRLFESNKSECLDEMKDDAIVPSLLLSKPVSSLDSLTKSKPFLEEALGRPLKQSENKLVEDAEKCRVEKCAQSISSLIDKFELSDEEISDLVRTLKDLIDAEKTEDFVWFENKDFDELPTKEQLNSVLSICISEEPENTSVLIREKMGLLKCGDTSKDVLSQLDSDISNANACFVGKLSDVLRDASKVVDGDPDSRIETTQKQLKRYFDPNKTECLNEMKDDANIPSLLLSKPVSSLDSLKKCKPYLEEALGRPLKQSENKLVEDAGKCRVEECAQSVSSLIDKIELSDEEISDLVRTLKDLIDADKTEDFVLFENKDFDELPTKEQLNSVLSICINEKSENTSVLIRENLIKWRAGDSSEDILSELQADFNNAKVCFVEKMSNLLRKASEVEDDVPVSRIETTEKQLKRLFESNKSECLDEMKDDAIVPSLLLSKPVSSLDSLTKSKPFLEEALGRPLKQSENKLVEDAEKCRVEKCAQSISSLIDKFELSDEEISDLVRTLKDLIGAEKTEDFVWFENKDFDELPTKEQLNSVLSICISEEPENTSVLIREKLIKWRAGDSSEDILSELQADFNNANVCFVEKMSDLLREPSEVVDDVPESRIETTERQLKGAFESAMADFLGKMTSDEVVPSLLLINPVSSFDCRDKSKLHLEESSSSPRELSEVIEIGELGRVRQCTQSVLNLVDKNDRCDEVINDLAESLIEVLRVSNVDSVSLLEDCTSEQTVGRDKLKIVLPECLAENPEESFDLIRETLWKKPLPENEVEALLEVLRSCGIEGRQFYFGNAFERHHSFP